MSLVDADDAGERTGDVVQNLLDDDKVNAKPRQAACCSAAQVMQRPGLDAYQLVEAALGVVESGVGRLVAKREDVLVTNVRQPFQQGARLARERHLVAPIVLDPLSGQRPSV